MSLKLLLCAAAVVSVALSATCFNAVPDQCPQEEEEVPTTYGHPDDCQYYIVCNQGTPQLTKCLDGTRWSPVTKKCVEYNSEFDTCTRENVQRECKKDETLIAPHPTACQRYYNCSYTTGLDQYGLLEEHEKECPYPQGFDLVLQTCRPYQEVYCGPGRELAKDPCDYMNNVCGSQHCEPCKSRLPSCVGLADGQHEHPLKLWSPHYISCKDERLEGPGTYYCEKHALTDYVALFSPIKGACVSLWEIPRENGGRAPSCDGKAPGQSYRSQDRPDVYYSCPDADVFYCGVGNVFSESTQQCEPSS